MCRLNMLLLAICKNASTKVLPFDVVNIDLAGVLLLKNVMD
jgi:hypothetical protein